MSYSRSVGHGSPWRPSRVSCACGPPSTGRCTPYGADALTGLGAARREAGDLAGAEEALTRAVDIYERCYGTDYPYLHTTLDELAMLRERQGRGDEGAELHARAERLFETALRS